VPELRVPREIPDEDDTVDVACHRLFLLFLGVR
jgi:hypothetical protein